MNILINRKMLSIIENLTQQLKINKFLNPDNCISNEYIHDSYKYTIVYNYSFPETKITFEILQREEEGKEIFNCSWFINKGYCSQFLSEILNKLSNYIVVILEVLQNA